MKSDFIAFLRIWHLLIILTTKFFKNGKVLIILTLLCFFITGSKSVFAQDKGMLQIVSGDKPLRALNEHPKAIYETEFDENDVDHKSKAFSFKHYLQADLIDKGKSETGNNSISFQNQEILHRKVLKGIIKPDAGVAEINKQTFFESQSETTDSKINNQSLNRFLKCNEDDFNFDPCSRQSTAHTPFPNNEDAEDDPENKNTKKTKEGFQWGSAIRQSLLFLAVQHGYAYSQEKTRRELKGNFFGDYIKSVKSLKGWNDGGRFFTNYIAHPMQGSFTGFIQIQNDPKGKQQRFGSSGDYWQSRMKAMAWSAAWSTQFEIGLLSQASIGNVGLKGKQTYIDLIITPTVGTAMLITEDAIDRFLIERIESKTKNYYLMIFSRMLLNPTRTVANLVRFKLPWYRDRPRVH